MGRGGGLFFLMTDLQKHKPIRGKKPDCLCFPSIRISLFWPRHLRFIIKLTVTDFFAWEKKEMEECQSKDK